MAKTFSRQLPKNLIKKLNDLHSDKNSWWHRLVNCRDVRGKPDRRNFFAVRDGYLSVYTNGGSLLKITLLKNGDISCQIHEEYVIQRTAGNPYVRLNGANSHHIKTIGSLVELVGKFEQARRRVGIFMGDERRNVGDLAGRILNVIDIEATAGPSESEGRLAMSGDRTRDAIDLMAVDHDGVIWSFEAKLLANKELRAREDSVPEVVEQIQRYSKMLTRREDILKAYRNVAQAYSQLDGRVFEERREIFGRVKDLRSEPVLVIFDYDRDQQQGQLQSVLQNLCKAGIGECVCMGNCSGITAEHLFAPRSAERG